MLLQTARLTIRDFTMEDFPGLWEIFSDPRAMEHFAPMTEPEARDFLRSFCVERQPPGARAAVLRETGKVIGYLLCCPLFPQGIWELGWAFHPAFWRQGYGFEALSALRDHLFRREGTSLLAAQTADALRSLPLLEKLGFSPLEGFLLGAPCEENARWYGLEAETYFQDAIGPAREADVPAIMDLLQRRIHWMDEKGLYQWNKTGYLTCYPPAHFLGLIRKETVLAAREEGRLTGIMALLSRDPRWPNGDDGKAYYVHHLATDPACPGLGKAMLSYAESYARRRGKPFLRLDSQKVNTVLSRYYEALGYFPAGECVDGAYVGILREKSVLPTDSST